MSLSSMTGYGRGEAMSGGIKVEVELASVNRKQFDVKISLPRTLSALEPRVYEIIHEAISRGAITGAVRIVASSEGRERRVSVDADLAAAYVRRLRRVGKNLKLRDDLGVRALLHLPEVVRYEGEIEESGKVWPLLKKALNEAITRLVETRRAEGVALSRDIRRLFGRLKGILNRIRKLAPEVPNEYREKLQGRLIKLGVGNEADDRQLLREVALFAERSDVTEEIVRLDSHFDQALGLLDSREPAGRALDFICQEMFREINTIGSKANNGEISRHVICFKSDLEKMREQVQNVE